MTYQPLGDGRYRVNVPRSAITGRYVVKNTEGTEFALAKHAALIARIRAALRLIGDQDITPMGRRVLERILDEESGVG